MADQFVAEIRILPFTFPPKGWAFCDGQLMPISQNTALFALLGTMYGGDGKSTFALPDLTRSAAMHAGKGDGLSERFQGEIGGSETVTLLQGEIPVHNHVPQVVNDIDASTNDATGGVMAKSRWNDGQGGTGAISTFSAQDTTVQLAPTALAPSGGSLPHNNMQPYLKLNFCIALQGIFPQRP